ncbi:lasso peptide biosynthesis PqqD family chaperone [Peribacillus sp. NPDC096379]|uniref:lasso peptide biosynthesis PqqD family chaperone n=1 Tax=Peribacillus sp. NPDC096379 TaxID=3364393 RepID=UPI0037FE64F0
MLKTKELAHNHLISQLEGNIVSDMDGETVMLSVHNGKYYNLGAIGGVIWELIKDSISIEELITTLQSQYDVEQTECEEQVHSFLDQLLEEGLIKIEA